MVLGGENQNLPVRSGLSWLKPLPPPSTNRRAFRMDDHTADPVGRPTRHEAYMRRALEVARSALGSQDVPVGAVIFGPSGE
jgi:hypothetical protein